VQYALRLGAGFGSQIAMSLVRWMAPPDGRRRSADQLGYEYRVADRAAWSKWLADASGYTDAEVEIVSHRLRIKDQGPPRAAVAKPQAQAVVTEPAPAPEPLQASAPAPSPAPTAAARPVPIEPAPLPDAPAATSAAPAAAPAPVVETQPSVAPPALASDGVDAKVVELVAQKTGYPADMLEMDLDLEADLGVDTVKQAEVFASIRGEYDIPRDENLKLRDFPTLKHVAQFVRDRAPNLPSVAAAAPAPDEPAAAPAALVETPPSAASGAPASDGVDAKVVELVAQKTGYPADMLEMDLDLEADLGVDTVKQAEVFASIRGQYDIPRDENLKLRDFPTLKHVAQFVRDRAPNLPGVEAAAPVTDVPAAAPAAAVETPPSAAPPAPAADGVDAKVIELVAQKTGYPADMLEMDLDLEADLGVDTVKQAEVFASIRGEYDIERDENLQLRDFPTLRHVAQFVRDRAPGLAAAAGLAPAAPAPPPPASDAATDGDDDEMRARVLAIVSEKTGYPADMLEMDLDLEADLGIDTVKQAEIFAAMREAYGIPRDPDLQLKDFPTLKHTLQFVKERVPQADAQRTPEAPAAAPQAAGAPAASMAAADEIPRRVPTAFLRPPLDLCKDTGVVLAQGARVVVMPDEGGVGRALIERLQKRGVEALVVEGSPSADELEATLARWREGGQIAGVYWLRALDGHDALEKMDVAAFSEQARVRVKLLATTMRALYEQFARPGSFLIAATRLGGKHGYDEDGALNPLGGAVSGFVKAFKRERGDALCKVVDFATSRKTAALADILIDETLRDPGAVEIGVMDEQRWTIGTREIPAGADPSGIELGKDTVFVVTGAAGSIVSAIIDDLAGASGGVFHLLDLTPEPDPDDPDIARFATDKDGLKRDIFERIKATGKRATPAVIDKELARLERAEAALAAIRAVEQHGGTAHYHCVNMLDVDAVEGAIRKVTETSGKIDVLIHAAGLEISRFLSDKTAQEFDLVFDVKCNGWHAMLHAIGDMPMQAAVVFSSVAGRFGNGGQTDYSAANDLLCKSISNFRNTRPDTLGVAIDWTAWGDIGMASRGSIPVMMAAAGIDMLPAAAGIPVVRRELTRARGTTEVVIAGRLGLMADEWDDTGGLDVAAITGSGNGPMIGRVVGTGIWQGLTVETELDPATQPFLHDHQIEGTPVLPGVMGLEGFAELSTLLLPDWRVEGIEDVEFLAPFKFYRGEPRSVRLSAQFEQIGDDLCAHCELVGVRQLKTQPEPVVTRHFTATVRLNRESPAAIVGDKPLPATGPTVGASDVYQVYFHGPAYRVLDSAWSDGPGTVIGRLCETLPDNHTPADLPTQIAPRLIELCFQTAGMCELGWDGVFGLPAHVGRVAKLKEPGRERPLYSIVRHARDGKSYDVDIVDQTGAVYMRLEDYRTAALPGAADAGRLAPIRAAVGQVR
jgi:acyl carrier protein/NAD(P)-dependent dehydrogenase (short-subunit alcohol dehydrogenase family)